MKFAPKSNSLKKTITCVRICFSSAFYFFCGNDLLLKADPLTFLNMTSTTHLNIRLLPQKILSLKSIQAIADLTVLCTAFVSAYILRFDFSLTIEDIQRAFFQILFVVPLELYVMRYYNIHKFIWRYISLPEVRKIVAALLTATVPLFLLRIFLPVLPENFAGLAVPFSITILNFCLATIGILGIRLLRREIYENARRLKTFVFAKEKKRVLLIGAGRAGLLTLAEVQSRNDLDFEVKGFIDDDKAKLHSVLHGVEVIGNTENLPQIVESRRINHVIITIASSSRRDFQRILRICEKIPVKVKTIPGLSELLQDKVIISRIRNVEVEDLLGRTPVQLDEESINEFLSAKTVLITGAGGSIGSELVRQILRCKPQKIVLVERSEFALFNIGQEINSVNIGIEIVPIIGDICDSNRMRKVFERFRPEVIFHAAAYKHVPMMESNPSEALRNNALGTNTVGVLAGEYNAEAFVLISTDKAVNPTSVMGATKRIAELIIQDLDSRFETRFIAVRFGNVIGSNGSVIPIFREQIKKGGPVTVTHPEMKRFFMTIPEASQLVMQAGTLGKGGEIFILDMGELVKILDLAKETIRLSGFKPDEDIQIVFTGMRPGEKLIEELESDAEHLCKTKHSKIFIGKISPFPSRKIRQALTKIESLCLSHDETEIKRFLFEFLDTGNIQNSDCDKFNLINRPQIETVRLAATAR